MRTFVVTDIHSRYRELKELLKYVNFSENDLLIINGDLFDRGELQEDYVDFILNTKNVKVLLGNHELMFMNTYEDLHGNFEYLQLLSISKHGSNWMLNGGAYTIEVLLEMGKVKEMYEFLYKAPLYYIHNNYFISHTGPYRIDCTLKELKAHYDKIDLKTHDKRFTKLLWDRWFDREGFNSVNVDYNIIYGHTRIKDSIIKIKKPSENIVININHHITNKVSMVLYELDKDTVYHYREDNKFTKTVSEFNVREFMKE